MQKDFPKHTDRQLVPPQAHSFGWVIVAVGLVTMLKQIDQCFTETQCSIYKCLYILIWDMRKCFKTDKITHFSNEEVKETNTISNLKKSTHNLRRPVVKHLRYAISNVLLHTQTHTHYPCTVKLKPAACHV